MGLAKTGLVSEVVLILGGLNSDFLLYFGICIDDFIETFPNVSDFLTLTMSHKLFSEIISCIRGFLSKIMLNSTKD